MDYNEELWRRVDELRGRMTIRELAERSGVSEPSLQTTRAVKSQPKIQMLYPIAKVLGTTMEYLYNGEREDWEDSAVFRKIASSQDLFDIASALCHAEPYEIDMVGRMLGIKKDTSASGAGASA